MELIAREALKSKLQKNIEELADKTGFFEGIRMGYESAVHFVEQAPTVEERKRGHWEDIDLDTSVCSVCKKPQEYETKYCPECGAKMENNGDDDDE